jgi:pyridine nucleotide-disulfide oxidoreductase family protein
MKRLLLAGGGHAHVHVLAALARAPLAGADVTLVTPFRRQMYSGMLPGWVAGHYALDQIVIPLPALAAAARVRLVEGHIVALDAAARRATLADGQVLDYDLLSLDTGPVMDRDALPGAREHGLFVRPIETFVERFDGWRARAAARPLDTVVVGGGAAGVELALALAYRQRSGGAPGGGVALVAGGPVLAGFAAGVRRRAVRALRDRGIAVHELAASAIGIDRVVLADGTTLPCDAAVIATGASAPAWLAGSGLALDARGFVLTAATLQSVSHPAVFAAGDVATRADRPHPKSGVYAVRAGPPLAASLRAWAEGRAPAPYTPQRRTLYLLSLGERRAIASWGPLAAEGDWVWRWKDRIDRGFIARYGGSSSPR